MTKEAESMAPDLSAQPLISIVSPVYMGEKMLNTLVATVDDALSKAELDYELILVDDGSPDESWEKIKENAALNKRVKGIQLSRNYGQHCAILAGLDACNGSWISVIDCDLQDDPMEIKKLFRAATNGYDIVFARRRNRKDGPLKRLSSKAFYLVFNFLLEHPVPNGVGNFGLYSSRAIKQIKGQGETVAYFPAMIRRVGFKSLVVDVEHKARDNGKSTYSFKRLARLALRNVIGFSEKPLKIIALVGFCISFLAGLSGLAYGLLYAIGLITVAGFTSIMISIWLTFGFNMFMLGVTGLYVGRCLEGTKLRSLYIVSDQT